MMTVGDLKKLLEKYPDDADVYGYDSFGLYEGYKTYIINEVYQSDTSLLDKTANDVLIGIAVL